MPALLHPAWSNAHRFPRRFKASMLALAAWFMPFVPLQSAASPDYARDIKPILEKRCYSCHGRLKQKAGLRLDAGPLIRKGAKDGPVLKAGNSRDSEIIRRILSTNKEERMPPEGAPLDAQQVAQLAAWIDAGAPSPANEAIPRSPSDHWAFQPVTRPPVPSVRRAGWVRNPIDAFVLAGLEAREVDPAPEAPPAALLRRIHLDLTGLPPSIVEQGAFAENPLPAARKLDAVVDELLKRPQYGERWVRHWLDLARYADSNGYERDAAKPMVWRYRDYVIRSLNADKPIDRFTVEQIAGDELPDATAETVIATGFHRLGHWDDEPADPEADRFDQLDDIIATTSEVFLGLTIGCARCHDHKFEPLTTRDYYSMVAIFNPLRRPQNGRTELTLPAGSLAELTAIATRDQEIQRIRRDVDAAREALRKDFLEGGRSRLPAETVTAFLTVPAKRTEAQKARVKDASKQLEAELAAAMPEVVRARIAIMEKSIAELRASVPDLPQGYFLHEPSPKPPETHILVRGNPKRPGDKVEPAVPAILAGHPAVFPPPGERTSRRRLAFAEWLVSPDNPLTARVLVNRVWQQHFGVGLVRTPGDFGLMGEAPTHPELLDWLAHWFSHDAHWSLKRLHQLILTSSTWRMSRSPSTDLAGADPENRLFSHVPRHRLEVEAIRDSILAVSGRLNPAMFGPPMFPVIPSQAIEANTDRGSIWKASNETERSRRTVYAFVKRGLVVPMLEVLDLCDTVHCASRRQTTTVAPQALTLFNGEFVNDQARHMASRLQREAGADPKRQIEHAFRLALCRPPRDTELRAMLEFLHRETLAARVEPETGPGRSYEDRALEQLCRVVLNLNEFVYPD